MVFARGIHRLTLNLDSDHWLEVHLGDLQLIEAIRKTSPQTRLWSYFILDACIEGKRCKLRLQEGDLESRISTGYQP